MGLFTLSIATNFKDSDKEDKQKKNDQTTDSNKKILSYTVPMTSSATKVDIQLSSDTKLSTSLLNYSLQKQVYAPCQLDITLQFSGNVSISVCRQIIEGLDKASVSLNYKDDKGNIKSVAEDYYVYQVNPRYIPVSNSKNIVVGLVAYSKDHLLTLENGSQSFTAKKFIEEIFKGDNEKICSRLNVSIDTTTHSQCLTLVTESEEKGKKRVTETEVIQPYLVQYDEPYYNFLARTANRCGELMYFENGKLCIGLKNLPEKFTPIQITKPTAISFVNLSKVSPLFTSIYADTVNDATNVGKYAPALSVLDDVATDEYIFKIKKGEWTTFAKKYAISLDKKIVGLIPKILRNEGLAKMLLEMSYEEGISLIETGVTVSSVNDKSDKSYFTPTRLEQRNQEGTEAYPFTSDFGTNTSRADISLPYLTTHEFYTKILDCERKVSSQALEIDFGTSYQHILLGDVIELDGLKYLVTNVKAEVGVGSQTSQSYKYTTIPLYTIEVSDSGSTSSHAFAFPPLYSGGHVRKSGVQRAFIYESKDPLKLGRVRIRYPWQKKLDKLETDPKDCDDKDQNRVTSSPWIRFSSDYTVNNGGICFQPDKDTEVLIDYENGNVEHPYVVGSLFNAKSKAYSDDSVQAIVSKHGHSIRLSDPKDKGAFVSGLWGGWGMLSKIFPPFKEVSKKVCERDHMDHLTGGIEMKDFYGFYSISMSTDKRAIKIDSPFGTVGINAFTGITISAPTGDVKIVGKNVSIVANNNLTLTSGQNIKNKFDQTILNSEDKKEWAKNEAEILKDTAIKVAKTKILQPFIDLRLVRTIWETILKPVEGTLKIKSFRYLMLEAGKGSAEIPKTSYKEINADKKGEALNEVLNQIKDLSTETLARPSILINSYTPVVRARSRLHNFILDHTFKDTRLKRYEKEEVTNLLNQALANPVNDPQIGHIGKKQKKEYNKLWAILKKAATKFYSDNEGYEWAISCTNINMAQPFLDDGRTEDKEKTLDRLRKQIKDCIQANNILKADFKLAEWDKFVDSIGIKENGGLFLLRHFLDVSAGLPTLNDGKALYPYVWSKNSSGDILLSNNAAKTMVCNDGVWRTETNLSANAVINAIKRSLRDIK